MRDNAASPMAAAVKTMQQADTPRTATPVAGMPAAAAQPAGLACTKEMAAALPAATGGRPNGAFKEQQLQEMQRVAASFIETTLGEPVPPGQTLQEALRDGIRLCRLANALKAGIVERISMRPLPFLQMENISNFTRAAQALGVPAPDLFQTVDLFENKDMNQVIICLQTLARISGTRIPAQSRAIKRDLAELVGDFGRPAQNGPAGSMSTLASSPASVSGRRASFSTPAAPTSQSLPRQPPPQRIVAQVAALTPPSPESRSLSLVTDAAKPTTPLLQARPSAQTRANSSGTSSPTPPAPPASVASAVSSSSASASTTPMGTVAPPTIDIASHLRQQKLHRNASGALSQNNNPQSSLTGSQRSALLRLNGPASGPGAPLALAASASSVSGGAAFNASTISLPQGHGGAPIITGDYQLGNSIGKGQFGVVYKALHLETGHVAAVKRIPIDASNEREMEELMKEVELLESLEHPNIVHYIGFLRCNGFLNIVLEYVENGSLASIIRTFGPLTERLAASYTAQMLQGLEYLHARNVVHRDLKAANILNTKDGIAKLSDFGVAQQLNLVDQRTQAVAGTPNWMAPEIIALDGASTKSDIWSLGCTLVELLTGRPPYAELNPMTALFRIVEDDGPPLPDGISPDLQSFLLLCFKKNPAERASAAELQLHPWILAHHQRLSQSVSRTSSVTTTTGQHTRPLQPSATASLASLSSPASPTAPDTSLNRRPFAQSIMEESTAEGSVQAVSAPLERSDPLAGPPTVRPKPDVPALIAAGVIKSSLAELASSRESLRQLALKQSGSAPPAADILSESAAATSVGVDSAATPSSSSAPCSPKPISARERREKEKLARKASLFTKRSDHAKDPSSGPHQSTSSLNGGDGKEKCLLQ